MPFEAMVTKRDGAVVPVECSVTPLLDPQGRATGVAVVGRDISERRRHEREQQVAHKLDSIGTLAGGIAHDFNNMLSVMLGNSSYVEACLGSKRHNESMPTPKEGP